jgi:hypothetical protein
VSPKATSAGANTPKYSTGALKAVEADARESAMRETKHVHVTKYAKRKNLRTGVTDDGVS